jgi:hypothetical protein
MNQATPASSCLEIVTAMPGVGDGKFWLKMNGETFQAYCDMSVDGGGWMLTYLVKDDTDQSSGPNFFPNVAYGTNSYSAVPTSLETSFGAYKGPSMSKRWSIWNNLGHSKREFRATSITSAGKKKVDVKYGHAEASKTASDNSHSFACFATGCGGGGTSSGYSNGWLPGMATMLLDEPNNGLVVGDTVQTCQVGHMNCNCWETGTLWKRGSQASGSCQTGTTFLYGDYCGKHSSNNALMSSSCAGVVATAFWVR